MRGKTRAVQRLTCKKSPESQYNFAEFTRSSQSLILRGGFADWYAHHLRSWQLWWACCLLCDPLPDEFRTPGLQAEEIFLASANCMHHGRWLRQAMPKRLHSKKHLIHGISFASPEGCHCSYTQSRAICNFKKVFGLMNMCLS